MNPKTHIMQAAIEVANNQKTPFGAAISKDNRVYAVAANQTKQQNDATAHAEVHAIRKLSGKLQNTNLTGFTLYTTCEPCPMCMSAIIWADLDTVVFGCSIPQISKHMPQIKLRCSDVASKSFREVSIKPGFMENECLQLLQKFSK